MNNLILKKEFPAKIIRAQINDKDLYLIVFAREGRYIGADFKPVFLTYTERAIVSSKLAELKRDIKDNGPAPISLCDSAQQEQLPDFCSLSQE